MPVLLYTHTHRRTKCIIIVHSHIKPHNASSTQHTQNFIMPILLHTYSQKNIMHYYCILTKPPNANTTMHSHTEDHIASSAVDHVLWPYPCYQVSTIRLSLVMLKHDMSECATWSGGSVAVWVHLLICAKRCWWIHIALMAATYTIFHLANGDEFAAPCLHQCALLHCWIPNMHTCASIDWHLRKSGALEFAVPNEEE